MELDGFLQMSIQNLRRRVFHDDIDRGRSDDSINEPLLGDFTVVFSLSPTCLFTSKLLVIVGCCSFL